mmetsp:Transcript_780/g.2117  ORF Transcript_780/g.2117 Transcript_780/m.2117 type:complete len:564 (+) Transcript_780:111-1802(+)
MAIVGRALESILYATSEHVNIIGTAVVFFYPVALLLSQACVSQGSCRSDANQSSAGCEAEAPLRGKPSSPSARILKAGAYGAAIVTLVPLGALGVLSCAVPWVWMVIGAWTLPIIFFTRLKFLGIELSVPLEGGRYADHRPQHLLKETAGQVGHGTACDVLSSVCHEFCFLCGRIFVRFLRVAFALFWVPYHYVYQSPLRRARSFDGAYVWEGIKLTRQIRYSNVHRVETFDILEPLHPSASNVDSVPIVYVHGGAFVACNSELELHSLGFLVRAGYKVYSLDYPLAPEHEFPGALLSVLRALAFLRSDHGVERIILTGDSAGGCIVAMAAALLFNRPLMQELEAATAEPLSDLQFPQVESLVCLYGILDQKASFVGAPLPVRVALRFIYDCYAPPVRSPLHGRFTLLDVIDDVHSFPRSFLIGGEADPIYSSTLAGHAALQERGFECVLKTYPATHAFLGFPCSFPLARQFQQSAVDCMRDILSYLRGAPFEVSPAKVPPKSLVDTLVGYVEISTLLGILPPLVYVSFGLTGIALFIFLGLCVSIVGFLRFYAEHSRWPAHW